VRGFVDPSGPPEVTSLRFTTCALGVRGGPSDKRMATGGAFPDDFLLRAVASGATRLCFDGICT